MATNVFDLFEGDGSTYQFTYTFDLLGSFSAVIVKVRPEADTSFTILTEGVEYVHNKSSSQIEFMTAYIPADATIIRVERNTTRERPIDYISGSTLTERNLDNDTNRLTSVDQEIEAGVLDALRLNDARDAWDGEGIESENCGPAVRLDGWVTLAQLYGILQEQTPIEVSDAVVLTWTGDGEETEYQLTRIGLSKEMIDVYIESIYQSSDGSQYDVINPDDSAYPSMGDGLFDVLVFENAPADGTAIEVKLITGTVYGDIADASITTSKILDDAVTMSKINAGTGVAQRFLVVDAAGDPTARVITGADLVGASGGTLAPNFVTDLKAQLRISDFLSAAANMSMGDSYRLRDMADPGLAQDAATMNYVDGEILALKNELGVFGLQLEFGSIPQAKLPSYYHDYRKVTGVFGFRPDLLFMWHPQCSQVKTTHAVGGGLMSWSGSCWWFFFRHDNEVPMTQLGTSSSSAPLVDNAADDDAKTYGAGKTIGVKFPENSGDHSIYMDEQTSETWPGTWVGAMQYFALKK